MSSKRTQSSSPPNILFVFPDQLGARWLPAYGNSLVQTPNLDRFGAQSTLFSRAYTNSPVCTPYRSCLFTGKYPSQTGVTENGMELPRGEATLADHLNDVGYDTRYIGKWHLSGKPSANQWVPPEKRGGFGHFIGWESRHVDHYDGLIWADHPGQSMQLAGHETDGLTDIVCRELQNRVVGRLPFFMAVSYQAPHPPCTPPDEYLRIYDASVLEHPPNTENDAWFSQPDWGADYGVEEFRKRYFGEISHLDTAFGRIMHTLDETQLADNTIIIFTSDHGEMGGCHGLFQKGTMFEEAVRVPLIVRMPGATAGQVVERPVATVDLFATLLDFAGATVPEGVEGCSFVPDLGKASIHPAESDLFLEYGGQDCVVRRKMKLVAERDSDRVTHVFDLERDPFEMHNLATYLDVVECSDLLQALNNWRKRTRQPRERAPVASVNG